MDSNVHPVVAFLIVALAMFAIGVWTWGTGEAKRIGGPSALVLDPSGHLYIQMQNQLIEHDENGVFVARHDLGELGVEQVFGGLAFFSNGDILLRRGSDNRSFWDNLRAYFRQENRNSLVPDVPDTGLYRCNLRSVSCQQFGPEPIDFKAAFGVYIDQDTDTVYISDTTRHLLRKYASNGEAHGKPVGGVKFPNELMLLNGLLYVADTNHHRIKIVNPVSDFFGTEIASENVVPQEATKAGQTWPSHFVLVGGSWWVNNMSSAMNDGGIYVFNNDFEYVRRIDLPPNADPIALIAFNESVLVSDWSNDRVYSVTRDGDRVGSFESLGLEQLVVESGKRRFRYEVYAWTGAGVFAIVILLLLLKGFTSESSGRPMFRSD